MGESKTTMVYFAYYSLFFTKHPWEGGEGSTRFYPCRLNSKAKSTGVHMNTYPVPFPPLTLHPHNGGMEHAGFSPAKLHFTRVIDMCHC